MVASLGIIIQARMGSTRLPGKVLKRIGDRTLLEHIFTRTGLIEAPKTVVVATSTSAADNSIAKLCQDHQIHCYRGNEHDVLERYYLCAKAFQFQNVVRMTADNPYPDMNELDTLIRLFLASNHEYANNFSSLPIGVGTEIFSFEALERSHHEGLEPHHREHVNEYMLENPKLFPILLQEAEEEKRRPDIRLTVDTPEDLRKIQWIEAHASQRPVETVEAIILAERWSQI